jgi:hypothetical protein
MTSAKNVKIIEEEDVYGFVVFCSLRLRGIPLS